jgi:hypothetical protein
VRTTPGTLPNRESGPQNQPIAKVAVFVLVGALASMGGISVAVLAPIWAVVWVGAVGSIVALSFLGMSRTAKKTSPASDIKRAMGPTNGRGPRVDLFMISFQSLSAIFGYMSDLYHTF